MKICVIGAGVIGVPTAYMLARAGHDVSVMEQADALASGSSHGNGAQLSYSHIDPFASPSSFKALPGYLRGADPAVRIRPTLNMAFWMWGLSFFAQSTRRNFCKNRAARQDLAELSKSVFEKIKLGLPKGALESTGQGKIVLAHTQNILNDMRKKAKTDKALVALSKSECIAREPALKDWRSEWVGGSYAQADMALDPIRFCDALMRRAREHYGVHLWLNQTVCRLHVNNGTVTGVETNTGNHSFDAVLVCTGCTANTLLKPLGIKVPIYPMRGYSVTLPAKTTAPSMSVTDMKNKIVYANLGSHIRIAGFMDTNQSSKNIRTRSEQLLEIAQANWPDIADYDAPPKAWSGCRPMVPGGVPVIGQSRIRGLYLNLGHGSLGFTLACGSAEKLHLCLEQNANQALRNGRHSYAT